MKGTARSLAVAAGGAWIALLTTAAWADATTDDIHEIRDLKSLPSYWVTPAVLAATAVLGLCAYLIWRRRRAGGPRTLSLLERTLERLDGTRPLMHAATARAFGIAASEVVRDYIEQRFEVVATQRTTEEFLQALVRGTNDALVRHRALLAEFLQQCDLVKFAGSSLADADMESLYRSARSFVLETGQPPAA